MNTEIAHGVSLNYILNSDEISPEQRASIFEKSGALYIAREAMALCAVTDAKKLLSAAEKALTDARKVFEQELAEARARAEIPVAKAIEARDAAQAAVDAAQVAHDEASRILAERNL